MVFTVRRGVGRDPEPYRGTVRELADVNLSSLVDGITWWKVLIAIVIVVIGWVLGRLARKAVLALMKRIPTVGETYGPPVARGAEYLVILFAIGLALAVLGANVQPLLAVVIIVAVIAVFVLRGTADNFAANMLIQARRTVQVGDIVEVDTPAGALTGTISELNTRAAILVTADGRTVHVPNAKLLNDSVVNDSSHGVRRSEVRVRLARGEASVDDLLDRVAEVVTAVEGVHAREKAHALVTAVTPERVSATVQFWHHPAHGTTITSDVVRALSSAFADRQVEAVVTSVTPQAPLIPPDKF